jgi:hypothetical protein
MANRQSRLQTKGAKEIQIFTVEDRKALADRIEPVYKEATARIGVELIEQARHFAAA